MAGYRPKSLDELNNLYDKAISAENEIKKGSSLLKDEVLGLSFDEKPKQDEHQAVARPVQPKEISGDIDDFILRFSGETKSTGSATAEKEQRKRPLPLADLQPKEQPAHQNVRHERIQHEQPAQPAPAPKNADNRKDENLSGLMSDYAKIMNGDYDDDEEDETFSSRKNLFKNLRSDRKGRKKASKDILSESEFSKKTAELPRESVPELADPVPVIKHKNAFEQKEEALQENKTENTAETYEAFKPDEKEEAYEPTVFSSDEDETKAETEKFEPTLPEYEPETDRVVFSGEEAQSAPLSDESEESENPQEDSYDEPYDRSHSNENFDFGDVEPKKRSGGVIFAKVLLSIILVLTLLSTAVTGVLVFTVNSERSLPGGYMLFSATNSYEDAEIKSNDFVICKKESSIADDDKVIFINRDLHSFSFGVKTGEKTDRNGNEFYTISSASIAKTDVLGIIVKTVPSLGKTVRSIVDNFLFILLGLVALAIAVTLILCLAFRNRSDKYYYDDESDNFEEPPHFDGDGSASHSDEENVENDYDSDSLFSGIE